MNGSRGDSVRSWFDTLTTNGNGASGTFNLDCFITGLSRFARNDGDAGLVFERGSLILGGVPCTAPFVLSLSKDERKPWRYAGLWFGFMVWRYAPVL